MKSGLIPEIKVRKEAPVLRQATDKQKHLGREDTPHCQKRKVSDERTGEALKKVKFATDNAFELARLRGEASKLELLEEAGPLLTPSEVAEALGKTKQAVHKRLQSGSLFGMINKGEFRIPAWQIREREVVPGIAQVLKNLDTAPWGKMLFLHSENTQLGGRRPADLILAGDIDLVAQIAASFGEQGAK